MHVPRSSRSRPGTVLVLVAVVAMLLAVVVPGWLPGAGPGIAAARDAGRSGGDVGSEAAIVMDASSSMLQPDEGGSRLDVAKRAASEMVQALPGTARVGMLAYGAGESDAPENREAGCADIRTLAPVGAVDKDRLTAEIDGLEARGYTPIGAALRAAAEELGGEGERSVVLVSDGLDTCAPPDPCEVAAELAEEGIGLTVHAIGFKVDPEARAQLECITHATGGQFRQADDAGALTESLQFLAQRAIAGYESAGTQFEFADTPEAAKYLGEGQYQTRVTAERAGVDSATERYVAVAVPEGHTAYIVGTAVPVVDPTRSGGEQQQYSLRLEPYNEDEECRYNGSGDNEYTASGAFEPPQSSVASIRSRDNWDCASRDWRIGAKVFVGEARQATDEEVTVELSVQFEPEASEAELGTMPAGDTGHTVEESAPVPLGEPVDVAPGNSFNNAAPVGEGTYRASIVPGESHFFRVPVGWNQRPVVTVRSGPSVRERSERLNVHISSPLRKKIGNANLRPYQDVEESTATVDRLVNYRNREANAGGRDRAVAGDHYIAVSMNFSRGVGGDAPIGVDQPYEFAVALDGAPVDGPDWRPVTDPGPEPTDGPQPQGATGGQEAEPGPGAGDDDQAAAAAESEGGQVWPWLVGGGLLVALVALGAVIALVSSRRR
ncbi:vWA domain-containing protein [Dietzia cinnamea]|uniref:vWA domain-containing protein n=1 Tax=Dietzia cinnamea TaxID=321318 RepID=UPI0021A966C6|nr:VWA domain-containing protein [Dietzia cinnamea]MCT2275613.1 VWA domain-containing protein [Dietzia cinnamea]